MAHFHISNLAPPSPLGRDFGFRQGNWGNPTKRGYATKYLNFLSRFSYINGFLAKNIIFAELNRFVVYSMRPQKTQENKVANLPVVFYIRDSSTRFLFLRLWGLRLGPTDVTHPLLTSVHCPFNLL